MTPEDHKGMVSADTQAGWPAAPGSGGLHRAGKGSRGQAAGLRLPPGRAEQEQLAAHARAGNNTRSTLLICASSSPAAFSQWQWGTGAAGPKAGEQLTGRGVHRKRITNGHQRWMPPVWTKHQAPLCLWIFT